ncbi:SDR family oxidoreductase [Myroides sp. NP-2]|uniref:dTDP-4-dehydrorhamnose reductase family protein n=1 Tax=Myroides sp. NP-2 TaxID=2759945 RepID=UPI0015FD93CD|nr:SDR family oxidoreductase [Myroides sp. NP-2]MBB1149745.1 SDR family oxidoreductase [Myroides sp. NP-2]
MKSILVVGIKGMAGHLLYNFLLEEGSYSVFGVARGIHDHDNLFNIDVANTEKVKKLITNKKFDYIINCIGILNNDAECNPAKAIWFNSYFPHFLEEITKNTLTKVIHISTDCVFSGKGDGGYTEESFKDGIGFYAQSKALGEIVNNKDVTIRTSIIGPELNVRGIGLFHWFMCQSNNALIKGFSKAFWSGITTLELAKVILEIIKQNITGLIQITGTNKIDKYSLLRLFNEIYRDNLVRIEGSSSYKIDKSLVSTRTDFNYPMPNYKEMLLNQKDWIDKYKDLYPYY